MKSSDSRIKKSVGRQISKNPLQQLKELNAALKKLGCKDEMGKNGTLFRKVVGRR